RYGKKELRLLSYGIMNYEVYPVFNDYSMTNYYGDKNIYDLIIQPANTVVTILRCIRGKYFDSSYSHIQPSEALGLLINTNKDMIIKPSNSNNGAGITGFKTSNTELYIGEEIISIHDLLHKYNGNFIIQEMLEQHPNMAEPHPASVNTLRMVTFRWKNDINYLLAYGRFGSDGDIRDNADSNIDTRIGVKDNGEFFDFALNQNGERFTEHPTTGFKFSDLKPIPNYDEFIQFVKDSHKNFLHLDIVSWDIAVGKDGKPIFIEANFAGPIPFYQLVSQKPMFGDLTDEVMEYVKKSRDRKKFKLMNKHERVINKRKRNRTRKKLKNNRRLAAELREELDHVTTINLKKQRNNKKKLSKIEKEKKKLSNEVQWYRKENVKLK